MGTENTDFDRQVHDLKAEYNAKKSKLLDEPEPDIDKIIACCKKAIQKLNDLHKDNKYGEDDISTELLSLISHFIEDTHRAKVVEYHAFGLSTTAAVKELVNGDDILKRLAKYDAIGSTKLDKYLVHKFSYLKPDNPRWSQKKYGDVWEKARTTYKEMIRDIPLSSTVEQVKMLAEDAQQTRALLENERNKLSVKDYATLKTTLRQTLQTLNKLTQEHTADTYAVQSPQLRAIIERVTLALDSPEQLQLTDKNNQKTAHALINLITELQNRDEAKTQTLPTPKNDNT